jgi:alpha-glucoside transport system ATP-binding protein
MANLKLTDVGKTYGGTINVLNDINLDITQGELIVFVGPSGCGKSTLLRMIAGLEKITEGTLEIDGMKVNDVPPAQRGIAMVFQSYALYPHMTVRDNMSFALKLAKKSKAEIDEAVNNAAKILQLDALLDRLPKALSGGQRQRVMIAMALSCDPKLLIADEPSTALDVTVQAQVLDEIHRQQEERNMGMILITHDLGVVAETCKRVIVMYKGKIVEVAETKELFRNPKHPYTQKLLDSVLTLRD